MGTLIAYTFLKVLDCRIIVTHPQEVMTFQEIVVGISSEWVSIFPWQEEYLQSHRIKPISHVVVSYLILTHPLQLLILRQWLWCLYVRVCMNLLG